MKKFFKHLFNPSVEDDASNTNHIYNLTIFWVAFLTFLVIIFLLFFLNCNLLSGLVTFLMTAGASFAGGASIGFLFGLPRAEKYRFIDKDGTDHNSKDYSYGDNTNLEEVSDWLTKIIVGLTLIKLHTIIGWIDASARSFDNIFKYGKCGDAVPLNAYVFGYCTIILYFLSGAGLCYLWARTNLSVILTKSKFAQRDIEKRTLIMSIQKLTNQHLQPQEGISTKFFNSSISEPTISMFPSETFKNLIQSVYNSKPVYDKSDIQRGRWGGTAKKGNYILESTYLPENDTLGIYKLKLSIRSLSILDDGKVAKEIAFFLHDTFASQIVFSTMVNKKGEIELSAYEAFVVGARLDDGTELELDLNNTPGFPEGFYWKE